MLRRPEHLVDGTPAVELVPELGPAPGDLVSHRGHGVSPFTGTTLDPTLRALGVSTVVATGVSLNLGIVGLAVEAVNLGYRVVVATDAVCGVPRDYADAVMRHTLALVATLATRRRGRAAPSPDRVGGVESRRRRPLSVGGRARPASPVVRCVGTAAACADPGGAEGDTAAATRPSAGTNEDPPQATTLEPPALTHR